MAAKRYYYSDSISDFLQKSDNEIIGALVQENEHDINNETTNSWLEEIETLRHVLPQYKGHGSVFFEYNIPRMGRRADVILLIDTIIFILEYKTAEQEFTHSAYTQVWDYALDLKNFQEGSLRRTLIPVLVCPKEQDKNCQHVLEHFEDDVYQPLQTNSNRLGECINTVLQKLTPSTTISCNDDFIWAKSGYEPTPTIIEAAIALYTENTVEDLTKHEGDVVKTSHCLERIIEDCREKHQKGICFITGVPGAGKTLIGLQTAINQFKQKEKAIYLSGNFPLVEVLQEALSRDYVHRSKQDYKNGKTKEKPCTKKEARSKVKAFIQMIHHYRDTYLEGVEVKNRHIVPIKGYFQSNIDKAYIPTEHIAIFDEAQRAWTKKELARFMKEKKKFDEFPYSEPEFLISCTDRHSDWGLVVCLIGGGQEINKGEAGIEEWINSINRNFQNWHVYMSDQLTEKEYANGNVISLLKNKDNLHVEPDLHLTVSMRSFRAEKVSLFVHQLLELNKREASATLKDLTNYPIVLTRSLEKAKTWLRSKARGSERMGLLASSKAERLKAISINVRYQPDFVHWFLEDDTDIRSSNALEDTLTEFKVQGLEIDWACIVWDADLRLNSKQTGWTHHQLRSGTQWQNINKTINKLYQINAYRVLLTRARQGMVIVVPEGDNSTPPDKTRKPEWYDNTYEYLREIGIKVID